MSTVAITTQVFPRVPVVCKRTVIVTTRVLGMHYWAEAPAEVGYLRTPHRHEFHIRAEWIVTHNDRDVEFHIAQGWLRKAFIRGWGDQPYNFGPMSCEMIAERLNSLLVSMEVPASNVIEVFEDGENGARVEFVVRLPA